MYMPIRRVCKRWQARWTVTKRFSFPWVRNNSPPGLCFKNRRAAVASSMADLIWDSWMACMHAVLVKLTLRCSLNSIAILGDFFVCYWFLIGSSCDIGAEYLLIRLPLTVVEEIGSETTNSVIGGGNEHGCLQNAQALLKGGLVFVHSSQVLQYGDQPSRHRNSWHPPSTWSTVAG